VSLRQGAAVRRHVSRGGSSHGGPCVVGGEDIQVEWWVEVEVSRVRRERANCFYLGAGGWPPIIAERVSGEPR